jgi:hypothetical protein
MIIGLTGYARSGKDTVARIIDSLEYKRTQDPDCVELVAFAEPMKAFCMSLFGFSHDQVYGNSKEEPDPRWIRPDGRPLTPRYALQTLGTEWGRNCDPDLWVKVARDKAVKAHQAGKLAIITDVRFVNEARCIREAGGVIWRIYRAGRAHSHASEAEIWSEEMTAHVTSEIVNVHTLESLELAVKDRLKGIGLTYE